jgi:hypothetical protein
MEKLDAVLELQAIIKELRDKIAKLEKQVEDLENLPLIRNECDKRDYRE